MSANNRITNVIKNADFKSSKRKTLKVPGVYIGSQSIFADDTNIFREHFLRCKSQKTVVVL